MGIVTGNEEYGMCMEEAAVFRTAKQLRDLFVTLILHGAPSAELWKTFRAELIEDLLLLRMTPEQAVTYALRETDLRLQKHGRSNSQVGLLPVTHMTTEYQRLKSDFARVPQQQYADNYEQYLSDEQGAICDAVVSAVRDEIQTICVIDAPAGTGKTFTERVIAARLRSGNKLVVIVASTGIIAALQLPEVGRFIPCLSYPLRMQTLPGVFVTLLPIPNVLKYYENPICLFGTSCPSHIELALKL